MAKFNTVCGDCTYNRNFRCKNPFMSGQQKRYFHEGKRKFCPFKKFKLYNQSLKYFNKFIKNKFDQKEGKHNKG